MTKPLATYVFRYIDGYWREVRQDAGILADVLANWELDFDYRIQFARVKDYDRGIYFIYRAEACKISLELWKINE